MTPLGTPREAPSRSQASGAGRLPPAKPREDERNDRSMDGHLARRFAAALPLLCAVAPRAAAHDKDFAYNVDWALPYRGEHELESWSTWVPRSNEFEQLVKYEYGVTDAFTIEPVLEFVKPNGDPFKLEAAELEAYYHFRD